MCPNSPSVAKRNRLLQVRMVSLQCIHLPNLKGKVGVLWWFCTCKNFEQGFKCRDSYQLPLYMYIHYKLDGRFWLYWGTCMFAPTHHLLERDRLSTVRMVSLHTCIVLGFFSVVSVLYISSGWSIPLFSKLTILTCSKSDTVRRQ